MKKKEINYQLLIRRICLIVLDIICIIAASILALLTRFEFDFSQIPKEFLKVIYKYGPFTIVITLIIFSLFRIYSSLWEYAGIEEVFSLIAACLAAAVAKIVIILFTWSVMPRSWYVLDTIYLMILIGATRVSYRLIRLRRQNRTFPWSKRKKVMIIGGGEAGRSLITEIQNSKYLDQKVVCIIDDDPYKIGRYIKGVKVVGNRNSIKKSVKKYNVQQIILTIPSANAAKIRPIVEIGGCKVRIGGMYEYAFALDGDNSAENLTGNVRDFLEEFQNTDRYKIMLCHRPDSFVFGDASDYWKIDLVISGHDHGGQVVIPFKGGLYGGDQGWFPPYVHGLYRTGRIRLFVTSGLSSEKQKLPRWNNRPEIAVLNVH